MRVICPIKSCEMWDIPKIIIGYAHRKKMHTEVYYSQSFVYCRVFVLLIIDFSTKKGVLVYSRKCASEIVYFRSNPYI